MNDIQWTQATIPVKDGGLGIRSVTVLAPSAFLASAAGTLRIQNDILTVRLHIQVDSSKVRTIDAWKKRTASDFPIEDKQGKQKKWENLVAKKIFSTTQAVLWIKRVCEQLQRHILEIGFWRHRSLQWGYE